VIGAMAAATEKYRAKIDRLSTTQDLAAFWASIQARKTPGWPSGKAFEYLIVRAFEIENVAVRYPYEVPGNNGIIEQIDGAIHLAHTSFLIESKDFSEKKTNIEPIAKLNLRLARRPSATLGILFSRHGLTDAALEVGIPRNLLLWQGDEIDVAIRNRKMYDGLCIKYRRSVEDGIRDYNLLSEGWP
jgi:hypothetical protein